MTYVNDHFSKNITRHEGLVHREHREQAQGHKSAVLWLTGLSGSGKSTLGHALEQRLFADGCRTYVLDGDNVRHGLCSDLGFSLEDRCENIRRIGESARLFMDAGVIVITAFISPLRADRDRVRAMFGNGEFFEIYCAAPLAVCESRDVKGLYKRARLGEISEFTGISSPYEPPLEPEFTAETGSVSLTACVDGVIELLRLKQVLGTPLGS
ncbi:MAG: adenylyl-sulfate kinase [Pseudomonadota bacterium]